MKESTMFPGEKFDEFKKILEDNFLEAKEEQIDKKNKDAFISELKKLDLNNSEILHNLIYYFNQIYWTAEGETIDKPLHTKPDFALELFAKVFSDLVSDVMGIGVTKTDFIMFLVGIIDDPYSSTPKSKVIELFAKADYTVLITGDTGTGKELHAKVIHYLSKRSKERFMAINCAGMPESLLDNELFGHEKGAFTGADKQRKGFLEEVGKGTLFLDEIGDMSFATQAKMLRVLQSGDYYRLGSTEKIEFLGRVVAATNRNLKAEINEVPPKFRPDLFYRLNVLSIRLPSLWDLSDLDRKKAILNKLRHVIYKESGKPGDWSHMDSLSGSGGPTPYIDRDGEIQESENEYISDEAVQFLLNYNFPGNYRELDNFITQAYILSEKKKIEVSALPNEIISYKKSESPQGAIDTSSIDNVFLKDIVDYADKIKRDIVRRKVEASCKDHKWKAALNSEGVYELSKIQNIRKGILSIIDKK